MVRRQVEMLYALCSMLIMKTAKDILWTWLLPDVPKEIERREWMRRGGKWIIFDKKDRIEELAQKLGPLIDAGEIETAKYWNGDPSAINVYSLDRERDTTRAILERLGARRVMVWEYDYAWDKNIRSPFRFAYSWFSKFRTILQSYGIRGTIRLAREVLKGRDS